MRPPILCQNWPLSMDLTQPTLFVDSEFAGQAELQDTAFVRQMLESARPEAVVCANNITAARRMHTVTGLGVRIPMKCALWASIV
jgi:hypothetical protein